VTYPQPLSGFRGRPHARFEHSRYHGASGEPQTAGRTGQENGSLVIAKRAYGEVTGRTRIALGFDIVRREPARSTALPRQPALRYLFASVVIDGKDFWHEPFDVIAPFSPAEIIASGAKWWITPSGDLAIA
jgi:hypothetical protein